MCTGCAALRRSKRRSSEDSRSTRSSRSGRPSRSPAGKKPRSSGWHALDNAKTETGRARHLDDLVDRQAAAVVVPSVKRRRLPLSGQLDPLQGRSCRVVERRVARLAGGVESASTSGDRVISTDVTTPLLKVRDRGGRRAQGLRPGRRGRSRRASAAWTRDVEHAWPRAASRPCRTSIRCGFPSSYTVKSAGFRPRRSARRGR